MTLLCLAHCIGYGLADHLQPPTDKSHTPSDEWTHLDSIMKSWIYNTLSQTLLHIILKKNTITSYVWLSLEQLFRDNKDSKLIQFDNGTIAFVTLSLLISYHLALLHAFSLGILPITKAIDVLT